MNKIKLIIIIAFLAFTAVTFINPVYQFLFKANGIVRNTNGC